MKPALQRSQVRGAHVVRLIGEHDVDSVADVRVALATAMAGEGIVVCDLTLATFLDSAILAALVAADADMRPEGRRLVVVLAPDGAPSVRRIFEISGLSSVLVICETLAAAIDQPG